MRKSCLTARGTPDRLQLLLRASAIIGPVGGTQLFQALCKRLVGLRLNFFRGRCFDDLCVHHGTSRVSVRNEQWDGAVRQHRPGQAAEHILTDAVVTVAAHHDVSRVQLLRLGHQAGISRVDVY